MADDIGVSKKLSRFYRDECCFPYSLSFLLVLVIYSLDFYVSKKPLLWPSILSYSVITAYYILNVIYYKGKKLISHDDPKFFISILTCKIFLWGILLFGLIIFTW